MNQKVYDLAVKVGEYQKDGQTKGRYQNIGVIMQGDNGPFLLLNKTFNPAGVPGSEGKESVIVSMFKVEQQQLQGYQAPPPQQNYPPNPPQQPQSLQGQQGNNENIF